MFRVDGQRAILARTPDLLALAGSVSVPAAKRGTPWGGASAPDATGTGFDPPVTAFVDTNVLVRHLTGDPPNHAAKATRYLQRADELLPPDLILAEVAYVLESFYETRAASWPRRFARC